MNNLPSNTDELALLKSAAAEAGRIAMRYFRNDPVVSWKEGMSPVSEADFAANDYLFSTLMAARPDYGWLSEETTDNSARLSKHRTFVVDPIDGTKAFIAGRDLWCVSVALVENGKTIAGILDCPARNEVFEAALGYGSFLNGQRLKMGHANTPLRMTGAKALLNKMAQHTGSEPEMIGHIPSLAYRIAAIADNRFDATFIKPDCHDWDIAAAKLILSEAGGLMLDESGALLEMAGATIKRGMLVAGNKDCMAHMLAVVAEPAFG
ncbi:MAG: 3'(2'),5'-bisphosphate nucleotidase CysQ [Rhizobiaceae bacterium]